MSSSKAPRAVPFAGWLGALLSLGTIALGVAGLREFAVLQGWASGTPWGTQIVDSFDGVPADNVVVGAAAVTIVVALVLLIVAVKPAPKTHQNTVENTGAEVWVTKRAVERISAHAARRTPGVYSASTRISTKTISVSVEGYDDQILEPVKSNIRAALSDIDGREIKVTYKGAPRVA